MWKRFRPQISSSLVTNFKLYSTRAKFFEEFSFPVPWGKVAGKWWGSKEIQPIICLHGFQDNCGTFNKLIPLIETPDLSFLAIDLPGHGYSSKFPRGMLYNSMSYLILLEQMRNHFKWPTVSFMSHSLGAIISFTYTMCYPEKVEFLVCMDTLQPINSKISAERIRRNIDRFISYDSYKENDIEPPTYTLEELTKRMASSFRNAIKLESAGILCDRNVAPSKKFPGKYYFSRDPMLKVPSLFTWPQSQVVEDASKITQPILIFEAGQNITSLRKNFHEVVSVLKKSSKDCDFHTVDGNHHVHLEEPNKLLPYINRFFSKYYREKNCNLDGISCEFSKSSHTIEKVA